MLERRRLGRGEGGIITRSVALIDGHEGSKRACGGGIEGDARKAELCA